MTGLAQILDENRRLRAQLDAQRAHFEAQIAEKEQELSAQRAELARRDVMVDALKARADQLEQHLAWLKLKARRPASERFVPEGQGELPFPSDVEAPPRMPVPDSVEEGEPSTPARGRRAKRRPKRRRREDFKHLPSRTVTCPADPGAACVRCGGALQVIGQAESFRIEWVPGHFIVEDVVRDKCACPKCPQEGVLTVPGPYLLDRALCGDALLARVIVDKFADHLPLHRQARRMQREGFEVHTNTLAGWIQQGADALRPLVRALRLGLLAGSFLLGDDTGLPVQDGSDGALRKGRMWAFTDQEHVFYAFTDSKAGVFPADLLAGFQGDLLLVDGGSEFNRVVRNLGLERAGCWSHLRRYFFEALAYHPAEAGLALGTVRDLFCLERELAGLTPEERRVQRQARAKPLVDGLFRWCREMSAFIRPASKLGNALTYALNQESAMRVYLDHGELPMHNNLTELMLRQPVVGRKNWLFAGSAGGAKAAADLYSLIGTCFLQGIDPHTYLVDVFKRLPTHPIRRIAELLPRAWRLEREGHMATPSGL
ncbi:MAG: IS66 family transposase [Alphaproteobacteria bacterium]|nr:IS66 family transposase [Alphaproteobacteria bacterium]MCB9765457.1 IS66 family transposase [Alphaproteobacteria bacterium]